MRTCMVMFLFSCVAFGLFQKTINAQDSKISESEVRRENAVFELGVAWGSLEARVQAIQSGINGLTDPKLKEDWKSLLEEVATVRKSVEGDLGTSAEVLIERKKAVRSLLRQVSPWEALLKSVSDSEKKSAERSASGNTETLRSQSSGLAPSQTTIQGQPVTIVMTYDEFLGYQVFQRFLLDPENFGKPEIERAGALFERLIPKGTPGANTGEKLKNWQMEAVKAAKAKAAERASREKK